MALEAFIGNHLCDKIIHIGVGIYSYADKEGRRKGDDSIEFIKPNQRASFSLIIRLEAPVSQK